MPSLSTTEAEGDRWFRGAGVSRPPGRADGPSEVRSALTPTALVAGVHVPKCPGNAGYGGRIGHL